MHAWQVLCHLGFKSIPKLYNYVCTLCMCVFMWLYACVHARTHPHVHVGAGGQQCSLSSLSVLFFETKFLSFNLGLTDLARLSGSPRKLSGILQLQMHPLLHPAFTSVLVIQLRSSCLPSHTLMTAISSAFR